MGRFLTVTEFVELVGEDEARQIAGDGLYGSADGASILPDKITAEIAFTDELVASYVLKRHGWLNELRVADIPHLLKGICADIVRYRLRDKQGNTGQVTETVEKRYQDAIKQLQMLNAGKLDLLRDKSAGLALDPAELHEGHSDAARISGPAPQSEALLKGYL